MHLHSIRALVTRPKHQAGPLTRAIRRYQGMAWELPMLEIIPIEESQSMRDTVLSLDEFRKIIVTSPNAARFALELIDRYWPQLPLYTDWYAIGAGTAKILSDYGINATQPTEGSNSETLLEMAALKAVNDEKVLIIKGQGGRKLLKESLQKKGANVSCLETYFRQPPDYSATALPHLLESNGINVILCSSGDTLKNLINYLPERFFNVFYKLWLVIPGNRVAAIARQSGFNNIVIAKGADLDSQLIALEAVQKKIEHTSCK